MKIHTILNISLGLYICLVILLDVKKTGIYTRFKLHRIRNNLLVEEGFFILTTLAFVQLEFINFIYLLVAIVLACTWTISDFFVRHKDTITIWIDYCGNDRKNNSMIY